MDADLVAIQKDIVSSKGSTLKRTCWVKAAEAKQLIAEGKAKPMGAPIGFSGDWHSLTDEQKVTKWKQYDAAFKAATTKQLGKVDKMLAAGDTDGAKAIVDQKLEEMRDGMGEELFNRMHSWMGQFPDAASAQAAISKLANDPLGAAMAHVYGKKWTQVADAMAQYGDRAGKLPGSTKIFGQGPAPASGPVPEKPSAKVAMSEDEAKQGIDHIVMKEFGGDAAKAIAALRGPEGDKAAAFFQKALGDDWKQKVADHIKEKFQSAGNSKAAKAVDKVAKAGAKLDAQQAKAEAAKQKWLAIKSKNEAEGIKAKGTPTEPVATNGMPEPTGQAVNLPPPGTPPPKDEQVKAPTFTPRTSKAAPSVSDALAKAEPVPTGLKGNADHDGKVNEAEPGPEPTKPQSHADFESHVASMPPHVAEAMKKAFGDDWQSKVKEHLPKDEEKPHIDPAELTAAAKSGLVTIDHADVAKATGMKPYAAEAIHKALYEDSVDPVEALSTIHGFDPDVAEGLVKQYAEGEAKVATQQNEEEPEKSKTGDGYDDVKAIADIATSGKVAVQVHK